jgi:hypothetical protein
MTYGTASITSATPAKDLMAALNTALVAGGMSFVETYATPANATWTSVAFGNGVYVALASGSATAATSPDGVTWTARTLPASLSWSAVTYGGSQFVAVASGSNVAATSPDGITWTSRTLPSTTTWSGVAWGGGTYVAIAANTAVSAASSDGITWTAPGMPVSANWTSVAYGGGFFAAVTSGSSSVAASSPDGINWTSRTLPNVGSWTSVTYGGGQFVTVNSGTAIAATSPTGTTWTSRTMVATAAWSAVAYGNGLYVTVATGSATAASSPDAITWTARTLPSTQNWSSMTYGTSAFVTIASAANMSASSSDAITWTMRTMSATTSSPTADVYKSAAASNQFGSDWYLILRRPSDVSTSLFYQVAENYSTASHKMSNYGGTGVSVIPTPGTYQNPLSPSGPDLTAGFGTAALVTLTTSAFSYWYSITANRFILGVKAASEMGFYAGLYDDLLPTGVTQFPLVCARFPTSVASTGAIGSNTAVLAGGFTRDPWQTTFQTTNFEAAIHNGYWNSIGYVAASYTPLTSGSAIYNNALSLSRVLLGTIRNGGGGTADQTRGLLIGCLVSLVTSAAGDTITSGGKTYVRFGGPNTTFGLFVDSSL